MADTTVKITPERKKDVPRLIVAPENAGKIPRGYSGAWVTPEGNPIVIFRHFDWTDAAKKEAEKNESD